MPLRSILKHLDVRCIENRKLQKKIKMLVLLNGEQERLGIVAKLISIGAQRLFNQMGNNVV